MDYKLIIRGELDPRYEYLFEPLRLEHSGDTTVISGQVVDQAQLHGLITRIEELGLDLVSVERVDDNS